MYAVVKSSIKNVDLDKMRFSRCKVDNETAKVDSSGLQYRELNRILRDLVASGVKRIELFNVQGQRYIGTSLGGNIEILISGTPGNDLGAFMDGPKIQVCGNAQDGCGNTMNSGEIVVHGSVGDIPGYAMRGGKLFIKENVGYRAGIHMKEYGGQIPAMVVGGTSGDFLAEYMAGGIIVLLGLNLQRNKIHRPLHVGTGMHGGRIYVRGEISDLGKETVVKEITDQDLSILQPLIEEFSRYFDYDARPLIDSDFLKITPNSDRPYRKLYAY